MHTIVQPEGWARPIGYANGIVARGRTVFVGGQVGWNAQYRFDTDDLVGQVRQALVNIVCVLHAARARPEHITSMTWYFVDKRDYLSNLKAIGEAYRSIIGRTFPVMAAMQVVALMEDRAKVEIQAIAVVPD
jgi:enamine deaminase RidA (YjgF/YER057c/UK114 family)